MATTNDGGGGPSLSYRLHNRWTLASIRLGNAWRQFWKQPLPTVSSVPLIAEIANRSLKLSDISDHLLPLFAQAMEARPKLIVELGVRGGESTFVLERVAKLCGAKLVSVDIDDCSKSSSWSEWSFIHGDDIEVARKFPAWCAARGLAPSIDFLFIDTSHVYEHTVQEIEHWFPMVSANGTVAFHDTNMQRVYSRQDGTRGFGWDNTRGVIAAMEKYFGRTFDETVPFVEIINGWLIKHNPYCSGFTVLSRLPKTAAVK